VDLVEPPSPWGSASQLSAFLFVRSGCFINGGHVLTVVVTFLVAMVNFTIASFHCRAFYDEGGGESLGYWSYFDGEKCTCTF
jgi:hypothetical protein